MHKRRIAFISGLVLAALLLSPLHAAPAKEATVTLTVTGMT